MAWTRLGTASGQPFGRLSVKSWIEQCEPVISDQERRLEGGFVNISQGVARRLGLTADMVSRKVLIANRSASTFAFCAINLNPTSAPKIGHTTRHGESGICPLEMQWHFRVSCEKGLFSNFLETILGLQKQAHGLQFPRFSIPREISPVLHDGPQDLFTEGHVSRGGGHLETGYGSNLVPGPFHQPACPTDITSWHLDSRA